MLRRCIDTSRFNLCLCRQASYRKCARLSSTLQSQDPHDGNDISGIATHLVFNQSSPFVNVDLWESDRTLQRAMESMTTTTGFKKEDYQTLQQHGIDCGSPSAMNWANEAEAKKPTLKQFDNYGRRVDIINYETDYHKLMSLGVRSGTTSYGYNRAIGEDQLNGHIARAGLIYMQNQLEPGHCCPLVMTSACIPVSAIHAVEASTSWPFGVSRM